MCIGAGKVKAIGVSNYTLKHLEEMIGYATIKPQVLQVYSVSHTCSELLMIKNVCFQSECHPLLPQREVRAYCVQNGIFFQAYSSLGTGDVSKSNTLSLTHM